VSLSERYTTSDIFVIFLRSLSSLCSILSALTLELQSCALELSLISLSSYLFKVRKVLKPLLVVYKKKPHIFDLSQLL